MAYEIDDHADGRHCVTAVFDNQADAETAKADLLADGFAAEDIEIKSAAARLAEPSAPVEDPSLLTSLLNIFIFMPSHDRMTLDEALNRGGVALAVRTDPATYERAIDILDRDGAIDLEEREVKWVEEGWSPANSADEKLTGDPIEQEQPHDPLVRSNANPDVRERIGVGTSDMTVGSDPYPPSAASVRDTSHGRSRVRSYLAKPPAGPADPAI